RVCLHQDAGAAGMVAAGADAGGLRTASGRIRLSHAPAGIGRTAPARRRRVGVVRDCWCRDADSPFHFGVMPREIGCFRFRSINSCRSRPRPTSGESGASSNHETRISNEVLRVTVSPAFAGDDTIERIKRRKRSLTMSWQIASLLLLGGSTVLLFMGIPVAFSFIAINLIGAVLFLGGDAGVHQLVRNSAAAVVNFSLTPIPLFVLMGEVLFHTGLALKVTAAIDRLIRQVPGRLAVVAVVAGTVFSAISGSTIATTAMLGSLMLPIMLKRGYHPTMATGPIMAIGAVDMLIPPSALTVLLGSLSGISISKLLIGGVVPGLVLSAAFVVYIIARVSATPALAPATPVDKLSGWARFDPLVRYVLPLVSIFVVVIGAMSGGI